MARNERDIVITREEWEQVQKMQWWAVGISIVSLLIALMIYFQVGDVANELNTFSQQQLEDVSQESSAEVAKLQAQARLNALRTRLVAQETVQDVDQEINDLEADLNQAYNDGTQAGQQQLTEFNRQLNVLEGQLRANSAEALATVETMIENLRRDIEMDEEDI